LVGAGVGLSFIPSSLAVFPGGVASAQTAGIPTLLAGPEFPIGLWCPPPPAQTTTQRYKEIATAGFNFVIGGNGINTDSTNKTALNAAKDNVRFVLQDNKLVGLIRDRATQTAVSDRIKQLLRLFPVTTYPARAGLLLRDEPHTKHFPILEYARGVLQGLESNQLPWVNLYGYTKDSTLTGVSTYEGYLDLYRNQVKTPFLSSDHYPLVSDTAITDVYFLNWATTRQYALREPSVPLWGFIQSVDFKWSNSSYLPRRRPNEAELFWQVNVALAYGAKGLQYFTYWTPQDSTSVTFGEALVTEQGKLTSLYDYAKSVNSYLRVVGKVLLPLTSESVVHAGENTLPRGATAFSPDGYVTSTSGSPVILGRFRQSAGATERYLLVVNRSFSSDAVTQLTLDASVSEVSELDSSTGTFARVGLQEPGHSFQLTIPPGRARLYLLEKTTS